ncbi:aminoglycoside phosphotransferase family protein [Ruania alkalisoli]|uniref:Aminoglycoside phosphotransferase family protein n=1 Tax=Ruania alkalisoli TaxID=2779775 RepID=A0A7M1SRC7_9MICO|nr:phosphotransferase [Ruania alkalisoli]QOR70001.1 aminoglycoside phosphotransferase family protein [Ruania alkalisoli]
MTICVPEDLALLSGPDSHDLVRAALGPAGVEELAVEVEAVHHRPGFGVSAVYRVGYRHAGATVCEHMVASTAEVPHAEGVATLQDGERHVRVWRRNDDPALPGLRTATDAVAMGAWLHDLADLGDGGRAHVNVLGYRPTRRAVLRVRCGDDVAYLKVLPAHRAHRLVARHEMLTRAAVEAPRVLGTTKSGIVALSAMSGVPLATVIADAPRRPEAVPAPEQVIAWLETLPPEVVDLPRRPSWVDRIDFHATAARAALPSSAEAISTLEDGIGDVLAASPSGPVVPTHGDFYEANVFVADGRVRGAIDLDSLGPGAREDDLATMLGHLSVLPSLAPALYGHVPELTEEWFHSFAGRVDPAGLAARAAAVVVSLIAGASPGQREARLVQACWWLRRAHLEMGVHEEMGRTR